MEAWEMKVVDMQITEEDGPKDMCICCRDAYGDKNRNSGWRSGKEGRLRIDGHLEMAYPSPCPFKWQA
jgi:hypothetical protein